MMKIFALSLLLGLVTLSVSGSALPYASYNGTDCRDYTNDLCNFQMGDMITSSIGDDEDFCQFLCSNIYGTRCTYFLYDRVQQLCKIYGGNKPDFQSYCSRFAGPPMPDMSECQTLDQDCHDFIESNCDYRGNIIQGYPDVPSVSSCQTLCQHTKGCDYFLYDYTDGNCDVINNRNRGCDILMGPPTPDWKQCKSKD